MKTSTKAGGFSYRPKREHAPRLANLVAATEHPKSFFLDKALEAFLPELEKRYERELKELSELNDAPNSSPAVAAVEAKVLAASMPGGGARPEGGAGASGDYKSVRLVRRQKVSSRRSKKA